VTYNAKVVGVPDHHTLRRCFVSHEKFFRNLIKIVEGKTFNENTTWRPV